MTCRLTCGRTIDEDDLPDLDDLDLVRTGRKEDFRWLARSQGVSPEKIDRLWQRMLDRTRADDRGAR